MRFARFVLALALCVGVGFAAEVGGGTKATNDTKSARQRQVKEIAAATDSPASMEGIFGTTITQEEGEYFVGGGLGGAYLRVNETITAKSGYYISRYYGDYQQYSSNFILEANGGWKKFFSPLHGLRVNGILSFSPGTGAYDYSVFTVGATADYLLHLFETKIFRWGFFAGVGATFELYNGRGLWIDANKSNIIPSLSLAFNYGPRWTIQKHHTIEVFMRWQVSLFGSRTFDEVSSTIPVTYKPSPSYLVTYAVRYIYNF